MIGSIFQRGISLGTRFVEKVDPLIDAVISVALQTLFIWSFLLISAAAFPIRFHPVLLPSAVISSVFFAAHFTAEPFRGSLSGIRG